MLPVAAPRLTAREKPATKPTVLIVLPWYLPGHHSGGPVHKIAHLVEQLGGEFHFRILTRDRDCDDPAPYPNIRLGEWQPVGAAEVCYLPGGVQGKLMLWRMLRETPYDALYLNSCYSTLSTTALVLRRLCLIRRRPTVIAPMGECAPAAIAVKRTRKALYWRLGSWLRLWSGLIWHAAHTGERDEIHRTVSPEAVVSLAPDLAPVSLPPLARREKQPGILRIVYLARIAPIKNLRWALDMLRGAAGKITFDIYGPLEDRGYWTECQAALAALPPRIQARYHGPLSHAEALAKLSTYHLYLLPTRSESFGHGILETLLAGCPVLISDQTPWLGLTWRQAGWDFPLDRPTAWQDAIREALAWDQAEFDKWSAGAHAYGTACAANPEPLAQNRTLWREVCGV